MFVMLTGDFPSNQIEELSTDESEDEPDIDSDSNTTTLKSKWKKLSASARSLISWMTNKDPRKRVDIREVLDSEWLSRPFDVDTTTTLYQEMF